MPVKSDSLRLASPYISFCLVNLLTASRVYLIPPIAVHGPKPMSIFHTVNEFESTGRVVLLRLLEYIVDTSPGSSFGLLGNRCIDFFYFPALTDIFADCSV